ncbi:caspase-like domain-containing protein [Bradyrhizobium sp. INPA01-394B]|uniref:Caspase family protein n=1 Tax=Bradyrhizobium campsiandrae TaxID=1729892 RepID=A0ABR7U5U8_9BRAD|nr:caspase family protein [Bradyrhizobium campsiandrae]MBC9881288.1 caspase-like domain-containing protein [Bradyrhizobium campsiandrae]MBC9979404.1 caspase family protein [Bradyrhizobium campsiandrae]
MRGTTKAFLCFLLPILLVAGAIAPAQAQQQEKRIALVVGNGAYSKSPLATAANDAGLIAQTLQAAGFDVVGARDLDGDTLRKSLRDFIQKAQASGPGTVAMIYLAGYGVQLAGENYFIPVDSNISRDTDIPTEALRISDYARQLAAIPLKANIIVLDAARAQPFVEGGQQPIASGLALVEPDPNMLIAFNAAPGTVAPEEPGPYGIYAQSLAEMIRTGGLSLPEVFDRVRLRVNENSKGAQVPWDDQKVSAQFTFFERAPDAPPPAAAPDQVAAIRSKPIRDLGVQDAYAAALERDTLPAYEEFLAAYPGDPLAKRVMAIVAARREAITWRRTYRADTPDAYWSYLRRYPRGPHAGDARRRLAILTAPLEPPPTFAMMDYDVPPPPPAEVVYVDRPVLYFSDPDFGFAPPPPPPVYFCPPPPPDFVVLPPPLPVVGLFVLPQPVFVPIPAFYNPPVYVAPPPNNIIVNNIHNTTVINTVINRPVPPPPPGNVTAAVSVAAGTTTAGATTHVPPIVQNKALEVQKNPTQLNQSQQAFVNNPTAKPGTIVPAKANFAPNNASTSTPLQGHALPLPDSKTGPASAGTGSQPGLQAPKGGGASTATAPAGGTSPAHPNTATAPAGGPPQVHPNAVPAPPTTTAPATATTTPVAKPPVGQAPASGGTDPHAKSLAHEPAVTPPTTTPAGKPPLTTTTITNGKPTQPSPPITSREQIKPQGLRTATPSPAQVTRPPPVAPHPQALARPTPPPAPRVAAPPPRPPVAAVRPPPPVAVARPAPPPVARPAPPPPPRIVAAPPPRPVAPPPRPPAPPPAAKKCPPNQPRC